MLFEWLRLNELKPANVRKLPDKLPKILSAVEELEAQLGSIVKGESQVTHGEFSLKWLVDAATMQYDCCVLIDTIARPKISGQSTTDWLRSRRPEKRR